MRSGVTIAGMLFVNNPGSWSAIHPSLRHGEWHGWTPTDLIWGFFLFIVGVSMALSFTARRGRGAGTCELLGPAARRQAIRFALGLLLHALPSFDLGNLRTPPLLQRIAYFGAILLLVFLTRRGLSASGAVLHLDNWAALMLTRMPGGAAGVLEPGRDIAPTSTGRCSARDTSPSTWDPEGLLSILPADATVIRGIFAGLLLRGNAPGRAGSCCSLPAAWC